MIKEYKTITKGNKFFDKAVSKGNLKEHRYPYFPIFKINTEFEQPKWDEKAKKKRLMSRISQFGKKRLAACIAIGIFISCIELTTIWNLSAESIKDYREKSGSYQMLKKTAPETLNYLGEQTKNESIAYIDQKEAREAELKKEEEDKIEAAKSIINPGWNGSPLSPSKGSQMGPSGKETYYNLNMSGVISIMRSLGFDEANYPYYIRSDGAKMLGSYIMVAANLNIRPKGTLVTTSMGIGIVADTGGFATGNPNQIDIATNW